MKKTGIIISLIILTVSFSFAQENKEIIREKIKARKVAFITTKIGLTSKEAEVFWPMYNDYSTAKKDIRKKRQQLGKLSEMTDREIEQVIDNRMDKELQLVQLKVDFITKVKGVLPMKKVAKLIRAEQKYKEWMLDQVKKS